MKPSAVRAEGFTLLVLLFVVGPPAVGEMAVADGRPDYLWLDKPG